MSERERKVWWHRSFDNKLRSGRAWLHVANEAVFSVEWDFGKARFTLGIDLDADDGEVSWRFVVPGVGLYFGLESRHLQPLFRALRMGYDQPSGGQRSFGVRMHEWSLSWRCWARTHEGRSTDPKWMSSHVAIDEIVLGERKYSTETLETREVQVPMPEGSYAGTAKLERCTWRRARWPFPHVITRCDVEVPTGVPIPGKGENSWDCGSDATYSMSAPARSIEDGIGQFVSSVLRTRQRHAGTHVYTDRPERAQEAS